MQILVDTNVLLRIAEPAHPMHPVALRATGHLRGTKSELVVVPQNLYEFWVVATRPADVNGLGKSAAAAEILLLQVLRFFRLLRDERAVFGRWKWLVLKYGVHGVKAHDARLVAAMNRHGVTQLLTFNAADFSRYQGITVLTPGEVLADADN